MTERDTMNELANTAALREPCVPGLFSEEEGARLHGARCTCCNTPYFPRVAACRNPACEESKIVPCTFGGEGRLWSYSVADFPPPPPHRYDKPFVPYAIGVVDLDSGLRVVGQQLLRGFQRHAQRGQPGLGAVVQVAFDPADLRLLGVQGI